VLRSSIYVQHYTRGSEAVVMVKREERDVVLLHRRGKRIDVAFPEDDELTGEDWYYAREAAFAQLRKFKGIPHELVDLVEGFQDHTVVQPFFYRPSDQVALRFGVRVKKSKPDIQRFRDSLAAYYRAQKQKRSWTASEALALVLRLSLRTLKAAEKTHKAAPVRTLKFVPRSLVARIAMYLLDGCVRESCPPGPRLNDLLRELLGTETIKHSVLHQKDDQKFLSFAARAIAQLPSIGTRKLARIMKVDPSTMSRWRRSAEFKLRVEREAKRIATLKPEERLTEEQLLPLLPQMARFGLPARLAGVFPPRHAARRQ